MKKTSKTLALIIACAMIFGMTACNKEEKESTETTKETTTEAQEETSEEETEPSEESVTSEETTEETTEETSKPEAGDYLKDLSLATTSKPVDCENYRDYVLNQNASTLENGVLMYDDSEEAGKMAMDFLSGQNKIESNSELFKIDNCISSAAYFMIAFEDGSRNRTVETYVVMEYSSNEDAKGVFEGLVKTCTDSGLDLSKLKPEEYSIEDNKGNFVMILDMASEEKLNVIRDKLIESGMSEDEADEIVAIAKDSVDDNLAINHFYFVDNLLFYSVYMTKDQDGFKTNKYLEDLGFADPFTIEPSDEWTDYYMDRLYNNENA